MQVRRNHILEKEFPKRRWRDDDKILSVLVGINISGETVEPLYKSLLRVWGRGTGNLYVEFPGVLIILMKRKPFIWIERRQE